MKVLDVGHVTIQVSSGHTTRCVSIDAELLANTTQSAEHNESSQRTITRTVLTLY